MKLKGFTLIELIVVIAIIAILAAIIAPNAFKAIEKAKIANTISYLKTLKGALQALYVDTGRVPGTPAPEDLPPGASGYCYYVKLDNKSRGSTWDSYAPSNLVNNDSGWTGWDGPYLESATSDNLWGGTIFLRNSGSLLFGNFLAIQINIAPEEALNNIDLQIDDANPETGNFKVVIRQFGPRKFIYASYEVLTY